MQTGWLNTGYANGEAQFCRPNCSASIPLMPWVAPHLDGGLGNRLFQYAAAAGLAERWKFDTAFLASRFGNNNHGSIATLFRMFPSVPLIDVNEPILELKEPPGAMYTFTDYSVVAPVSTLIGGARQNITYFPKNPSLLQPDWDSALGGPLVRTFLAHDAGLAARAHQESTVSIHFRLGDYRYIAHHQIDLGNYYRTALDRVPAGCRLHLFSDEPALCQAHFQSYATRKGLTLTVAKVRSDIETLYEMSLCLGGNIVGNSTFSWWAAWYAHAAGSPWATYPEKWGNGLPSPGGLVPNWGEQIAV